MTSEEVERDRPSPAAPPNIVGAGKQIEDSTRAQRAWGGPWPKSIDVPESEPFPNTIANRLRTSPPREEGE